MFDGDVAPYTFAYEATFALTLVQPSYNFDLYPNDQQTLNVRYALLNYDADQLQMYPLGIYCSQLSDGSCAFSHNPIWSWDTSLDTCTVYYDEKASSSIWPAYTQYSVTVSRAGSGLIVRLVLPITFLLLLSAVTFWLSFENRVDTTITLLLSISALYIVILQNIPMVGYLTNIDKFVFAVRNKPLHDNDIFLFLYDCVCVFLLFISPKCSLDVYLIGIGRDCSSSLRDSSREGINVALAKILSSSD